MAKKVVATPRHKPKAPNVPPPAPTKRQGSGDEEQNELQTPLPVKATEEAAKSTGET